MYELLVRSANPIAPIVLWKAPVQPVGSNWNPIEARFARVATSTVADVKYSAVKLVGVVGVGHLRIVRLIALPTLVSVYCGSTPIAERTVASPRASKAVTI